MSITVVKPKNGSKRFYTEANFVKEGADGSKQSTPFRGERFPKSFQVFRPNFNENIGEWAIDMSDEELNRLVKKCRFMHNSGPLKGTYIEEADRYNRYDPFFIHEKLVIVAEEGKGIINNSPVHEIVLAGMRRDPRFMDVSSGRLSHGRPADVKYELRSENTEILEETEKIDIAIEASELFAKLTFDKMLIIARALEMEVSNDIKPESLKKLLYREGAMNDKDRTEQGVTYQRAFVDLASAPSDVLYAVNIFSLAKRKGILRKYSGDWKFQGESLGTDRKQVLDYLISDEGSEILEKIESAINAKH